jgi:arabinan endo-1,5-alpha-L-arabinosidase
MQSANSLSYASNYLTALGSNDLTGVTSPVRDPSIAYEDGTYYVFSTDAIGKTYTGNLRVLSSTDRVHWASAGTVFPAVPAWLLAKIPALTRLWSPDISYFGGAYHLYYAATAGGSQASVIGLATNATLDPSSPNFKWMDQGEVYESKAGDDSNAIDPNILVDERGDRVWLTYGSYWTGIKQREIDPSSGYLLESNPRRYNLVNRPEVPLDPVEGPSMIRHGGLYYLFVSMDSCCNADLSKNDYKVVVGRSSSPHGPFVDADGTPLMQGGGTVLLEGDGVNWVGVGGQTAYEDQASGKSMLVFQGQKLSENGKPYLWVKNLKWQDGWPTVE